MDKRLTEALKAGKFAIVGVGNTLIDMGVYALLAQFMGFDPYLSQVVSYSCGMLNSYVLNRSWTFRSRARFFGPALIRFVCFNLLMLGVSTGLLYLFLDRMGLHKMVAKVLATGFTLCLNFVASRLWVFRE